MALMPALLAPPEAKALDFDHWMRAEQRRVFLLSLRLLESRDDADTATQDTFLKAYQAAQRGQGAGFEVPSPWLTRIAVNTCLDRLRSRRWQFWRRFASPQSPTLADACPGPEQRYLAGQIAARLVPALGRLSARQRAVFVLRHYEDCSLAEIAAALGLEVGTVKAHLARALVKLRAELRDLYFPEK